MRIGEIAIVGPQKDIKQTFIRSIADSIEVENGELTFGRYSVNEQLILHLYGIAVSRESGFISWEIISPKLLGFIALFRWGDAESFRKTQALVDELLSKFDTEIIVAGHTEAQFPQIPAEFEYGIPIDKRGALTFCNVNDPASAKKVLLTLVNHIIDQME